MSNRIFYTPDGFNDHLPAECVDKRQIEARLRELFAKSCYQEVQTPGFEFLDIYAAGDQLAGTENLFKTFDERGRILAARFDGTVGVARLAATKLAEEPLPLRLSYIDDMYRYVPERGSRLRSFTQAGLEMIGAGSPGADGEVIAMAIQSALTCGLEQIHVAVGQADFYKSMLEEWELDGVAAGDLTRMIDAKSILSIENFCETYRLSEAAAEILHLMLDGEGSYEQIDRLESLVNNNRGRRALDNLRAILAYLGDRDMLCYISLDLGMLQSLNYYTGMMFKGYTYTLGTPLFSGGRYDRVMEAFGKPMPATGFSINLDEALAAVRRQGGKLGGSLPRDLVLFKPDFRKPAIVLTDRLRSKDRAVELGLDSVDTLAEAKQIALERRACTLFYVAEKVETILF